MTSGRPSRPVLFAVAAILAAAPAFAQPAGPPPTTPPDMVATYSSVADIILAAKKAEAAVVRAILETTYGHAQGAVAKAKAALKAGDAAGAQTAVESLATLVGQIATEGDSAVAGIRKRLLEGGHHHHTSGEAQGKFEEGYVVVTRAAKTAFLESSRAFGQMARNATADGIEKEWAKVQTTWSGLMKK